MTNISRRPSSNINLFIISSTFSYFFIICSTSPCGVVFLYYLSFFLLYSFIFFTVLWSHLRQIIQQHILNFAPKRYSKINYYIFNSFLTKINSFEIILSLHNRLYNKQDKQGRKKFFTRPFKKLIYFCISLIEPNTNDKSIWQPIYHHVDLFYS